MHNLRHEKASRIATIDCSAATFDSSNDGESSAGLSASAAEEESGDDGGVTAFVCSCGESLSSSGNMTFHMHSSQLSRLSIIQHSCSVCLYRNHLHLQPGVRTQTQNIQ